MLLQNAVRVGAIPSKHFLYARKGPWPQPSPKEPLGTAPEVLHLPWQEVVDFQWNIGLRYLRDLVAYAPRALLNALAFRELPAIEDAALESVLTRGLYSRFLAPLDEIDRQSFGLAEPADDYWKMDFTPIASVDPYEGMYVAPTVTLLRQTGERFALEAIAIGERRLVLRPGGGPAWDLAKYFVLQGCSYGTLFTQHPNVHFPYDSINAITKSSIPVDHLVFKLLAPHLRFSLVLNNAVLQSKASVISDFRHTVYDPFTAAASDGLMSFFVAGYRGIPGNSAYPGYAYPRSVAELQLPPTSYGQVLRAYFEPFHFLTREVVSEIADEQMGYVEEWSRWIRGWIPTFPELPYRQMHESVQRETRAKLAFALAVMMWDVTVVHSTDHYDFAVDVPVEWKCFRLRVPPPVSTASAPIDRSHLSKRRDVFQSRLAHRMFFAPTTVTRLVDTEYDFPTDSLRRVQNEFHEQLRAVDAGLAAQGLRRFIPIAEIAQSIQY